MSGPIAGEGPSAISSSHLCACFQREMMKFVDENDLEACFPYLDNVTICGKNQENRDANMEHFLEAARRKKLCYNTGKCIFSTRRLPILRYIIEEGTRRPDSDRLRPQLELPFYTTRSPWTGVLDCSFLLFTMDSKVVGSNEVSCLFQIIPSAPDSCWDIWKSQDDDRRRCSHAIDEIIAFEVETDASEVAVAATLNQNGRPFAFLTRTLQGSELKHASIEKDGQAIIEAVRHWRHFLNGRHFILKTDDTSVSYMFDKRHRGKIKNEKFLRWRLELSCFSFDIIYRPEEITPRLTRCPGLRAPWPLKIHSTSFTSPSVIQVSPD